MYRVRFPKFFLFIIFSVLLKSMYEYQVVKYLPDMYMMGVSFGKNFNIYNLILGWIIYLFFLPILFISHEDTIPSYVIEFLFFINFMPILSSYGLNNSKNIFFIFNILYWILIFICHIKFKNFNIRINFFQKYPKVSFRLFIFFIILLSLLFIYKYNHFHISFNLADVYDVRAEMAGNLPTWFSWIKNCFGNVGFPLLIVVFLQKKKYLVSSLFIVMELLMFSVGMDKTYMLLLLFSIGVGFFYKPSYQLLNISSLGVFFIMFLSQLECSLLGSSMLFYMVVRRTFYVPVWINQMYFDFFNHNEKLLFTQNVFVFSKFLPNTYDESVYSLINKNYFLGKIPSPNTGMFAESYMHLGYAGILFFPFLMIFLLKITEHNSENLSLAAKYTISFSIAVLMSNIPITGGFFSSVWLFLLVLLFLLNSYSSRSIKNEKFSFIFF